MCVCVCVCVCVMGMRGNREILEVDLFAFAYKLFHEDFSPLDGAKLTSIISVCKTPH